MAARSQSPVGASGSSVRSKSHATSTHEKPKQERKTVKVLKRRRIEGMRSTDEGRNKDFDDNDGFTTSGVEAMLLKDRCIRRTNRQCLRR